MSNLTDAEVDVAVKNFFLRNGASELRIIAWEVKSLNTETVGFFGKHDLLTVRVECFGLCSPKTIKLFVKSVFLRDGKCNEFIEKGKFFVKEPAFYNTILHHFRNYSNWKFGPECYLACDNDVLILEDLAELGYSVQETREEADLEHCTATLAVLSRFHATSIVFEELSNTKLDAAFGEILAENWFLAETEDTVYKMLQPRLKILKQIFATHFPDIEESVVRKVLQLVEGMPRAIEPSRIYRNVLCHGDLWAGNVMYRRSQQLEALLVDFQVFRYNPPAHDVLLFLHLNTSHAFRLRHQAQLISFYYGQLGYALRDAGKHSTVHCERFGFTQLSFRTYTNRLVGASWGRMRLRNIRFGRTSTNSLDYVIGLDPEMLLPADEFHRSCRDLAPTAVAAALGYLQTITLPRQTTMTSDYETMPKSFLEGSRAKIVMTAFSGDDVFRQRLTQALLEAVDTVSKM